MTSFTRANADDVSFTANVLFTVQTMSQVECGQECLRHETCVTFTFVTSEGFCRGHNDVMSLVDSHVPTPLARSFVRTEALCSQAGESFSLQAGLCVRAFNDVMSFDDANQTCNQHGGGHIMHLKTAGELQLLESIIAEMGWNDWIWVGADDKQVEGEFRWSDGSLLDANSAVPWASGEPNNYAEDFGQEDCVNLSPGTVKGLFDMPCDQSPAVMCLFVCQIDM
ncbi:hypothetical protein V1264_020888 [Littorina saxatilis]|uniref:C-type lectin domain-containing protein n=2 Tax=Littorina saxatilis TaxID=31220 RepID=A0AAN9GBY7_9CAEN